MTGVDFSQPALRTTYSGGGSGYTHPFTGVVVPSVTTVSGLMDKSRFLVPWAVKLAAGWVADNLDQLVAIGDRTAVIETIKANGALLRSDGRDLGSMAHNVIEALSEGQPIQVPDEVKHHVRGWLEWTSAYVSHFEHIEKTVWSHTHGYAGTFDSIVVFKDGRRVLCDVKTGANVYAEAGLQLAALRYADVLIDTDGEKPMPQIDGCGVLHLPAAKLTATGRPSSTGHWSWREVRTDRDIEFDAFLSLLRARRWSTEQSNTTIGGKQTAPPT